MTEIIRLLPSTLQVECLKYLVNPNERIIIFGSCISGKTAFIRKCSKQNFETKYVHTNTFSKTTVINPRVKIIEITSAWQFYTNFYTNIEKYLSPFPNNPPTRIIFMASVVSVSSLYELYNKLLPLFLDSSRKLLNHNYKIDIVLTHTDQPRHTWCHLHLRRLKVCLNRLKINNIYWISNKTDKEFDNDYFTYLQCEF